MLNIVSIAGLLLLLALIAAGDVLLLWCIIWMVGGIVRTIKAGGTLRY